MTTTTIEAGRVLAGEGLEAKDGRSISIENGVVASIGLPSGSPRADAIDARTLTVLPGFIDAHVHIGFADPSDVLRGGITTARDLAWPEDVIFGLVARSAKDDYPGPRLLAAGPMLTAPGGYPTRAGWAPPGTGLEIESPDHGRREVGRLAARDVAVIKIALNPPVGPTLDLETLRAIVEEAHARGLKVTGHVHGRDELVKALDAGVDELAHVLMSPERIPEELIDRMVEQGLVVVPTLSIFHGRSRTIAIDNLARFVERGGRVIYGTDLGNAGPRPGIDKRELKGMIAAGIGGRAIINSATVASARWLGLGQTGVIAAGARADLIGVKGDPLSDPPALCRVKLVVRGGSVVRS